MFFPLDITLEEGTAEDDDEAEEEEVPRFLLEVGFTEDGFPFPFLLAAPLLL